MPEKLTVIAGSMFSGKTEELIRRVTRAEIAGRGVDVFKPSNDTRWDALGEIRSHSGSKHLATPIAIEYPEQILEKVTKGSRIVAVDETQFFNQEIVPVVQELLEYREVLADGLPTDFRGEPFGAMPTLLAKADEVIRLSAICTFCENGEICGVEATRTQRLVDGKPANYNDPIVLIGAAESYAARCPRHHVVPGKPEFNTRRK